jgi:hypothetical protein
MTHLAEFDHPYLLTDVPTDVLHVWWEDTALWDPDSADLLAALYPIVELVA